LTLSRESVTLSVMVKVLDPRDGYDRYWQAYAGDHRKLDSFDRETFLAQLPGHRVPVAVDLGTGDGRLTGRLRRSCELLIGADISLNMLLASATRVPGVVPVQADLSESLPFADDSVDLVTAAFFFVHVHMAEPVIREVARILKPAGVFVFNLIPQRREPELKVGRDRFKIKSYYHPPVRIERCLDDCWFDWQVEDVTEGKGWVSKVYRCIASS